MNGNSFAQQGSQLDCLHAASSGSQLGTFSLFSNLDHHMKSLVTLRDHFAEQLPFHFQGFWEKGSCFLRVVCKDGRAVFFCCQLPEYSGTSVTNAVESIQSRAIEELLVAKTSNGEPVLDISISLNVFEQLFRTKRDIENESMQIIFSYIRKNSIWIEHYPPNIGLGDAGSYALVYFSEGGEPTWNYVSKEYLQSQVPGFDLDVSVEELRKWK